MATLSIANFHTGTTAVSDGQEHVLNYSVTPETFMILDIAPVEVTALTVNFEGQGVNGNYVPVVCYNMSDGSTATSSSATDNQLFQVQLAGLDRFRVRVSTITGESVSISGKVIG